jgi:hypothetical protein
MAESTHRSTVAVLNIGPVDDGMDEVTLGIGEDVALAPLDLLTRIVAAWAAGFRGFHALTIDDAGAGRSLAPLEFPHDHEQHVVDRQPQAAVAPQIEPASNGGHRWEAGRQHPPRQPATKQIKDRLDDPAHRPFTRTAHQRGRWEERLQDPPLRIRQIRWQSQLASRMLRASDIGPHCCSSEVLRKTPESATAPAVKLRR